ncbi:MAG: glycosyltransferase [Acetobacter sp.]|nr:glycosyltransferase [Bacteroides sp.]MCM1341567.1 glycosyltransferase [Acetobacter sp.]MCM1433644.1 glycosyltransferase [Clostridiales bacterium]
MKYSVIIPVYNAEKYLNQCVESVLSQTFSDLEVILVDDGSPDKCPQLCDAWAERDSRVKALHVSNGGASRARNTGLDNASGEYIIFLDSDDYWNDSNALQELSDASDADVVIFGCTDINMKTGEVTVSRNGYDLDFMKNSTIDEVNSYLLSNKLLPGGPVVFAVKRNIVEDNKIRFMCDVQAEDYDYVLSVFTCCKSVFAINNPFYSYRRNQEFSVTSGAGIKTIVGSVLTIEKWLDKAENDKKLLGIKKDILNYLAHIYSTTIVVIGKMTKENRKKAIEKIKPYKFILKYAYWKQTKLVKLFLDIFGFDISVALISKVYRLLRG